MSAAMKRRLKCNMCKKVVLDTVITRHMWKSHRPYMIKAHGKGVANRLKNSAAKADSAANLEWKAREAEMTKKAEAKRKRWQTVVQNNAHRRIDCQAQGDRPMTIIVHQGVNRIEITKATRVEVLE